LIPLQNPHPRQRTGTLCGHRNGDLALKAKTTAHLLTLYSDILPKNDCHEVMGGIFSGIKVED
jgi:hypothetical protein